MNATPKQYDREFLGLKHTSIVAPLDKRPHCRCCGERLKLRTWHVYFESFGGSGSREADNARLLAEAKGWSVVELKRDSDGCSTGEPRMLAVWDGGYCGYGFGADNERLFCKQDCAVIFASASYRAGYRLKPRTTETK
jgi:hypothetical protein